MADTLIDTLGTTDRPVGKITTSNNIYKSVDNSSTSVYGGTDSNSGQISLYGKNDATNPGYVSINANNGTNNKSLIAKPTGDLTWNGNIQADSYVKTTGITTLQRNTAYAVGDVAYHASLPSWAYLECTTAGTTGATEPTIS